MRNKDRQRRIPQVEALESLVPLSGAAGAIDGALAAKGAALVVAQQIHTITGTVNGGYVATGLGSDRGATYRIGTAGKLTPLGETAVSGKVQTTGFIAAGMASGSLTLTDSHGNLKLQIAALPQGSFGQLPARLNYTITSGTHSYRGVTGSGAIAVSLHPSFFSKNVGTITLQFLPGTTAVT